MQECVANLWYYREMESLHIKKGVKKKNINKRRLWNKITKEVRLIKKERECLRKSHVIEGKVTEPK